MNSTPSLAELLIQQRDSLLRFVQREGAGLLKFESSEDLVQGIHHRALLTEGQFQYRSEGDFAGWIFTLARAYIADRHEHWSALKRGRGKLLRLTWSGGDSRDPGVAPTPAGSLTGPLTWADRREQLRLAVKVLGALPPRDQQLVRWMSQGLSLEEQAGRLGISREAAQRAAHRSVERYRKAFQLLLRNG